MDKKEKRSMVYEITKSVLNNASFNTDDLKSYVKDVFREIEKAVNELEDEDIEEDSIGDGLPI